MDFRFDEESLALRDLAREILEKEVTLERLKQSEAAGNFFDRELWMRLADANLLGIAVPEAYGGMGMGFLEPCLFCAHVGRTVAPLPLLPALVHAGLPLARFGSDAQRERWLPALAKGEAVLAAALGDGPLVVARREGDALVLDGARSGVQAAGVAERVLVPCSLDGEELLALVDPPAGGVPSLARPTPPPPP